jgi:hypothetical protein
MRGPAMIRCIVGGGYGDLYSCSLDTRRDMDVAERRAEGNQADRSRDAMEERSPTHGRKSLAYGPRFQQLGSSRLL